MVAMLAILPSVFVLWAVAWLNGVLGARLPKKSWKKLPLAALVVATYLGVPVLQIHLLTVLKSERFARDVFIYVALAEYIPGIVLIFLGATRENREKSDARHH